MYTTVMDSKLKNNKNTSFAKHSVAVAKISITFSC